MAAKLKIGEWVTVCIDNPRTHWAEGLLGRVEGRDGVDAIVKILLSGNKYFGVHPIMTRYLKRIEPEPGELADWMIAELRR
jgi:hypothetical protein